MRRNIHWTDSLILPQMNTELYVIVSPDYPPHSGGVERYASSIAKELVNRGKEVIVITSEIWGLKSEETDNNGITILRFPTIWFLRDRMPVTLPTLSWKRLRERLKQYSKVCFFIQTNLYVMALQAARFANKNGYKSVVTIHGSNYVCTGNGIIDRLEHIYERMIVNCQKKNGTLFSSVSKGSAEFVRSLGCEVAGILPNAVSPDLLACNGEELEPKEKNKMVFTYAGRLIKEKGVIQLVRAFKVLSEHNKNISLNIIGDGPLLDDLKTIGINVPICFFGQQENSNVISILRRSNAFILPSDSEGLPTSVLEATVCMAFPIVSPFGGSKEIIEATGYGIVMNGNSVEDIVSSCGRFLSERPDRRIEKENVLKKMNDNFSWSETVNRLGEMFA